MLAVISRVAIYDWLAASGWRRDFLPKNRSGGENAREDTTAQPAARNTSDVNQHRQTHIWPPHTLQSTLIHSQNQDRRLTTENDSNNEQRSHRHDSRPQLCLLRSNPSSIVFQHTHTHTRTLTDTERCRQTESVFVGDNPTHTQRDRPVSSLALSLHNNTTEKQQPQHRLPELCFARPHHKNPETSATCCARTGNPITPTHTSSIHSLSQTVTTTKVAATATATA